MNSTLAHNPAPNGGAAHRPGPRRAAVVVARILGIIVGLILLAVLVVTLLPDSVWRNLLTSVVSKQTGRQVSVGQVELHVFRWNPELIVQDFSLANADWRPKRPMFTMKRLDLTLSLASLFKLHLIFPRIEIDAPDLDLERDAANRANWDFSTPGASKPMPEGPSKPTHIPVIQQLIIADGKLQADDRVRKLSFNGAVSIDEKANSGDITALRIKGNGSLNAKPFDLKANGGPLINVDVAKPYEFDTAVTAADIKLTTHARIEHPFDLADVTSSFHLSGSDLADFYYLTGLALPNTPPYDLSGTAVRHNLVFDIDDFHGRLGNSDIAGKISIDAGRKRPKLVAVLNSKQLNLADLAAPLGTQATPDKKSGTLAQPKASTKSAATSAGRPMAEVENNGLLLPDADLQVNRVRAMDADVRFAAASIVAQKLPLNKVAFHLVLDDGKITLDPLQFSLPEGQFSGSVGLNARGPVPDTTIDMKLENVDLAQFKPQSSDAAPLSGQLAGRIRLHGTGASVHKTAADVNGDITIVVPEGQVRSAFAELTGINLDRGLGLLLTKKDADTAIRCGVFNFHADNGDLQAKTLVVDTTKVLVTGSGDLDLGDEELNMSLRGQPKGIRLVRLRSPIEIHGTLLHPKVGLETKNLAGQAGGAVLLGTLLTPVAALLAFVDLGLAKNANCAALIGEAQATQ